MAKRAAKTIGKFMLVPYWGRERTAGGRVAGRGGRPLRSLAAAEREIKWWGRLPNPPSRICIVSAKTGRKVACRRIP